MKHFIIETTYLVPFEQLDDIRPAHRAFLQTGYQRGWCLCAGPKAAHDGGLIIARAPSVEELQDFLKDDPYNQKKLATYRLIEFEPVSFQPFMEEWVKTG